MGNAETGNRLFSKCGLRVERGNSNFKGWPHQHTNVVIYVPKVELVHFERENFIVGTIQDDRFIIGLRRYFWKFDLISRNFRHNL